LKGGGMMGTRNTNDCRDDCLCRLLRTFRGEEVTIITKSGDVITGVLDRVRRCCVRIISPATVSPPQNRTLTVIRCEDIESFSVELLG
jgi:small nuclear ribonucleoprotein (snRNP)-like protein